jgi:hypothetical protein
VPNSISLLHALRIAPVYGGCETAITILDCHCRHTLLLNMLAFCVYLQLLCQFVHPYTNAWTLACPCNMRILRDFFEAMTEQDDVTVLAGPRGTQKSGSIKDWHLIYSEYESSMATVPNLSISPLTRSYTANTIACPGATRSTRGVIPL